MLLATGTVMSARTIDTIRVWWPDWTVSVTRVPARPLISAAEKFADRLASEVDPTCVITSPRFRPALAAGEPWKTPTTSRPWGSVCTSIPMPRQMGIGLVLER